MTAVTGFVEVRPYAELNAFVAAECRGVASRRPFRPHQTVKDVAEAMGIPHTEIDLIVVDGEPVDFGYRPRTGARIAVYPVFEALGIEPIERLRPAPLRDPRFVADVNVGKLARYLRLLGFDVQWSPTAADETLARVSTDDQRILLTRDRGLLARKVITHGLFVHAVDPVEQVVEVVRRLDLTPRLAPFTRCMRCNDPLVEVPKSEVLDQLEPLTRRYYDDFRRCVGCGRVFWAGSHHDRLVTLVETIRARV